jgi:hypothetical protein
LIYTNDFAGRFSCWASTIGGETLSRRRVQTILTTAAVLAIGFAPRWAVFLVNCAAPGWPQSFRFLGIDAAYNFYVLFVSQSVAPWFWRFSIPAAVAVIVLLAFVFADAAKNGAF